MTRDPSSKRNVSEPPDDSYWAALFKQEAANIVPSQDPETESSWSGVPPIDNEFAPSGDHKSESEIKNPWQLARELNDSDQDLQLMVTGCNKGGLLVQWNELQGFVPASQLIEFPQFHFEAERIRALRSWIGQSLTLKIVEINQNANRLVLSERAALVKADQREHLLTGIQSDDTLEGKVTNLTNFGAFVDLGGVEGLIHISELSWSRVSHPSDVVKPDQPVTVLVLEVDQGKGRVALSLKRLRPNPWETAESRYKPGQLVDGVVSNVVNFGAFILLEEELEGLIHISELAEGTFLHPRNVVRTGDRIVAKVLSVNSDAKRLALSLRRIRGSDNGR